MRHRSASQIETYDSCARKWAWRYVMGLEAEGNASAQRGTLVHQQLENWTKGQQLDLTTEAGNIAFEALPFIPPPLTPGVFSERTFTLRAWGDVIIGQKDLTDHRFAIPKITDYKTTSALHWAKTESELRTDIQAVIYATDEMVACGTDEVDLEWLYIKATKPYKVHPVRLRLSRDECAPTLERIRGLCDEMDLIQSQGLHPLQLPFKAATCDKYGGCPHVPDCNLTDQERFRSIMTQQVDSEAQRAAFLAQIGGQPPAVNPPPAFVLPEGGQYNSDKTMWWKPGMPQWELVPSAAQPPPPAPAPPPPPPAQPPAQPPAPPAPKPWTPPEGAKFINDGKDYWAPGMSGWEPVPGGASAAPPSPPAAPPPSPPPAPPPVAAGAPEPPKRGPGRPRKNPSPVEAAPVNGAPPPPPAAPSAAPAPATEAQERLTMIAALNHHQAVVNGLCRALGFEPYEW